jgi:isopenicillin N synthase-like dioxygenase
MKFVQEYTFRAAATDDLQAIDFFRPVPLRKAPYTTGMGQNLWPSTPADFRATAESYIEHLERLGTEVMKAIAIGLSIDKRVFLDRIDRAFGIFEV